MGDFNLDLLKFETHNDTDAFLNAMLTTNFQPQILQPTRITNHTATLIALRASDVTQFETPHMTQTNISSL